MSQALPDYGAAVAANLMEQPSGLPDYEPWQGEEIMSVQRPSTRLELWWEKVDDLWEIYGGCEGLCSRVEVLTFLIEYACSSLSPLLAAEEQITREMLGARISFEASWLLSQPLLVFSRQCLERYIAIWRQTYAA
jgi:hypothetical protein